MPDRSFRELETGADLADRRRGIAEIGTAGPDGYVRCHGEPLGQAASARSHSLHWKPIARWYALYHRARNGHVHPPDDLSAGNLRGLIMHRQQEFRIGEQFLDRGLLLAF